MCLCARKNTYLLEILKAIPGSRHNAVRRIPRFQIVRYDRSWKKRNKNSGLTRFFWISLPKTRGIASFPILLYDFSYIFRQVRKIFSFLNGAENQIFVKWTKIVQRNEKIHESTKNRIGHQREEIWRKSSFLQRKIRSLYEKSCLRVYIIYIR